MKKIVLTGGPCSGKSTTLTALRSHFGVQLVLVPEVATMILSSGFPGPGRDVDWSPEWQAAFQSAVLPLQKSLEQAYELVAAQSGAELLVCDRGTLDGAAYTPGGAKQFCEIFLLSQDEELASYEAVIHLESLATAQPSEYGQTNNCNRFEALKEAQALEAATHQAWKCHSRHFFIEGRSGIDQKVAEAVKAVELIFALLKGGE